MESTAMRHIWKMGITSTAIKSLLIDWWTKRHGSHWSASVLISFWKNYVAA